MGEESLNISLDLKCQEKSKPRSHIGNTNSHFSCNIISISISTQLLRFS